MNNNNNFKVSIEYFIDFLSLPMTCKEEKQGEDHVKYIKHKKYIDKFNESLAKIQTNNYIGTVFRCSNMWGDFVPLHEFINKPIKYMEIGVHYGANAISVANSYCSHKDSRLYCIDPWSEYPGYEEYSKKKYKIYKIFLLNILTADVVDKVNIFRDLSSNVVKNFEDNFFDIIYIDGNHEPEYILEDAVLSFQKLKTGGYMIFDDYGWVDASLGIDSFTKSYQKKIKILGCENYQLYLQKL
jgi:predicted O-methyltransferase YrrM